MTHATREPIFNLSESAPLRLAGVLMALHALWSLTPLGRNGDVGNLLVLRSLDETRGAGLISLIGHGFAHADWGHVLMNSAFIVIFGIVTIRGMRMRDVERGRRTSVISKFLAIFAVGVVVGGLFQWGWWSVAGPGQAVGASGGASALFAAAGYAMGGREQMVKFGIAWVGINVLMVLGESVLGVGIAWAAHLGGFAGGMIVAPLWVRAGGTAFRVN